VSHINKLIRGYINNKVNLFQSMQILFLLLCLLHLMFYDVNKGFIFVAVVLSLTLGILSLFLSTKDNFCHKDTNFKNDLKLNFSNIRDMKSLLRGQRHDYMNLFQVIYGYLQLKKSDKASDQIKKIINLTNNISPLYNLSVFSISLLIEKKIREADNQGIEIISSVNNYIEQEFRTTFNERQIIIRLSEIFDTVIQKISEGSNDKIIHLCISEYDDRIDLIFKGNLNEIHESDIIRVHNESIITSEEIRLVFGYEEIEYVKPEETIYSSILNNV